MKMRKKLNQSQQKRKKHQQSESQTGSGCAVVRKKGKLHAAVGEIGDKKQKVDTISGASGDLHCESTSYQNDVPELLKNKLENVILEFSDCGFESLLVVFTVTRGVIWKNGSALGKQFLEKTPEVSNNLSKFCTEQSVKKERDDEEFTEQSPAVNINENQEKNRHREDMYTVNEVRRDKMEDTVSIKKDEGNKIETSKASTISTDKNCDYSKCPLDNKRFAHKRSLNRHVKLFHARGSSRVSCKKCKRHFTSEEKLAKHMLVHKNRHLCKIDDCTASFSYIHLLEKHKLDCHRDFMNKYRPFLCSVCGDGFLRKVSLKAHMEWKHPNGEPVECDICNKSFRSQIALSGHKLSHNTVTGYVCELCGAQYKYRGGLFKHKQTNHRREQIKKFQCEVCGNEYKEKNSLHHHIVSTNHITATQKIDNRAVYQCDKCDKKFGRKDKYVRHYVCVHIKEPVCTCSYCGKSFCDSSDYKQHLRKHTGEKPTCEICKSTFRSMVQLKKHILQSHTTENKEIRTNVETIEDKVNTTAVKHQQVSDDLHCEVPRPVYLLTQLGSQSHTTVAIEPSTSHTHENIAVVQRESPYVSPLDVEPHTVVRPDNVALLHVEDHSVSTLPFEKCIHTNTSLAPQ